MAARLTPDQKVGSSNLSAVSRTCVFMLEKCSISSGLGLQQDSSAAASPAPTLVAGIAPWEARTPDLEVNSLTL